MLAIHAFVGTQHGRLQLKFLLTYAQELNPVEYLWGYWKHHALPNFCPTIFWDLSCMPAGSCVACDADPRW